MTPMLSSMSKVHFIKVQIMSSCHRSLIVSLHKKQEKKEPSIGRLDNRHDSLSSPGPMNTGLINSTEGTDEPVVDVKPIVVSSGDANLPQPSEEKGKNIL